MSLKAWEKPLNRKKCVTCDRIVVSPHPISKNSRCGKCYEKERKQR